MSVQYIINMIGYPHLRLCLTYLTLTPCKLINTSILKYNSHIIADNGLMHIVLKDMLLINADYDQIAQHRGQCALNFSVLLQFKLFTTQRPPSTQSSWNIKYPNRIFTDPFCVMYPRLQQTYPSKQGFAKKWCLLFRLVGSIRNS